MDPKAAPTSLRGTEPSREAHVTPETTASRNGHGENGEQIFTFRADDGEVITFDASPLSPAEVTTLGGEEALGHIWNRSVEDDAWQDM